MYRKVLIAVFFFCPSIFCAASELKVNPSFITYLAQELERIKTAQKMSESVQDSQLPLKKVGRYRGIFSDECYDRLIEQGIDPASRPRGTEWNLLVKAQGHIKKGKNVPLESEEKKVVPSAKMSKDADKGLSSQKSIKARLGKSQSSDISLAKEEDAISILLSLKRQRTEA